ncbi:MAG: thermonuclease family protein [Halobaculum sp.]
MLRRNFLKGTAGALGVGALAGQAAAATGEKQIPAVEFYSTSSLLDSSYDALTDDSVVACWAAKTATNEDADGNGDAYIYPDELAIPVAATDWNVTGFGSILVADSDVTFEYGNEEFLLNVWDSDLGGSGTVLWDESHGQYWTLSKCSSFESYAEDNGYDVRPTSDLSADLRDADAVVVTSPGDFTETELQELYDFVANGGAVYLHDQADYSNYDETENLNDIAGYLGLDFRFNDDEVLDSENNDGNDYEPVTDEFNDWTFDYFDDRRGRGLDYGKTYEVTVTDVTDGDTVDVEFPDGSTENIRILGLDTPETSRNSRYERVQEWEGISDENYLTSVGGDAKNWAKSQLANETVDLFFDPNEPVRDPFGRVLGYLRYDKTGDGSRDTLYNREVLRQGYARVYDSTLSKHDDFLQTELDARADGRNVWSASDPAASSEIRDRAVDDQFFPNASSVRTTTGAVADSRVPVYAESTATQRLDGGVSYSDVPLVAVDESVNTAMVGGLTISESYEKSEGFGVDTSDYENFVFLTNLIDYLGDGTGEVLIDGGHGQFGHDYSLSAEDAAYYLRYLEGQGGIQFRGVNDVTDSSLSGARALIVTPPTCAYAQSELDAVSTFVSNGGSLVLLGSAKTEDVFDEPRRLLDDVAAGVGSDLRLNDDQVVDSSNNVNGDEEIPATTRFDSSFPLFDPYS